MPEIDLIPVMHAKILLPKAVPCRKGRSFANHIKATSQIHPPPGLKALLWQDTPANFKALDDLRARLQSQTPFKTAAQDDELLKWYLRDRKFDVDAAEKKLITMLQWRQDFGADQIQLTDIAKESATGKAYLHQHTDSQGRPVVIIRGAHHVTNQSPLKESQQLCVYILDRAMDKLSDGSTDQETVLGIFALKGFTTKNADVAFVKFMIDAFFTYYPKRVSQVLFVDAPWVFQPLYSIVKPLLKKYSALVRFVSSEEVKREYFAAGTVPEDFL